MIRPKSPRPPRHARTLVSTILGGHYPAPASRGRAVRLDGYDQPPAQTDQDRRPHGAPRPRHHLPAGRGGRHRPDGARHPRRHPPPSSATVMRVTAIRTRTERNRQGRSVHRAEKRGLQVTMTPVSGLIRPTPGVCATADTTRGGKNLSNGRNQAILPSRSRSLGECRLFRCRPCNRHVSEMEINRSETQR